MNVDQSRSAKPTVDNAKNSAPSGPDRRAFLRTGTVAALASGLGAHAAFGGEEQTSKSAGDTVNIGVIGTGGRGGGATNDNLTINDNVRLVALCDLYENKCQGVRSGMAQRHGKKVDVADNKIYSGLDGYRRVLDDPEVDLVLLTTSPGFRPYHIAEAVAAGKHIFAEKPTCVDPAGYRLCIDAHTAAEAQKTAIVTGTQYRRQINYVEAVNQINEGAIGDVVSATTRYCSGGIWYRGRKPGMSDTEYQLNNWMHFIWLSGDQITEQAVHNIDAMNWVMGGPPETAYGSGGRFRRPADSEMWDSVSIDYVYPGNRVLSFMCRQIAGTKGDNGNVIYGTEGICYIGAGNAGSKITDFDGKETWSKDGKISDAYKQEHKDLVDSIRAGKPIVELRDTAESSLTAVMGRLAAYTGQLVTWDFVAEKSTLDLFPKDLTWDGSRPEPKHAVPGITKLV